VPNVKSEERPRPAKTCSSIVYKQINNSSTPLEFEYHPAL
jgi:hypothetical protein